MKVFLIGAILIVVLLTLESEGGHIHGRSRYPHMHAHGRSEGHGHVHATHYGNHQSAIPQGRGYVRPRHSGFRSVSGGGEMHGRGEMGGGNGFGNLFSEFGGYGRPRQPLYG